MQPLIVLGFLTLFWLFQGCGTYDGAEAEYESPPPAADPAFDAIAAQVAEHCGRCHNGSTHPLKLDNGPALKASKARARIENGSMPPSGDLPDDAKQAILGYLGRA